MRPIAPHIRTPEDYCAGLAAIDGDALQRYAASVFGNKPGLLLSGGCDAAAFEQILPDRMARNKGAA